jgi:hypothetical protein
MFYANNSTGAKKKKKKKEKDENKKVVPIFVHIRTTVIISTFSGSLKEKNARIC